MKKYNSTLFLLLVFPLVLTTFSVPLVLADVMSFNEAIDAVSSGEWNTKSISYGVTGGLEQSPYVDEQTGITGVLVWLAPNGTFYQVEYPSEKILGKIAESDTSDLNPPDGYTFWWLNYGDGEYWIDASDGSILHFTLPRGDGPTNDDPFSALSSVIIGFITSGVGLLLLVISIAIVGAIVVLVLTLNRKRKSVVVK